MKYALLFFALLISFAAPAQKKPTKAEIDKMMKQAMEMSKRMNSATSQKNTAKPDISSVPKRPLTPREVAKHLQSEIVHLKKQVDTSLLRNIQQMNVSSAGEGNTALDNAAAARFYSGSMQEAIFMQIRACQKDTNDLLGLNNLAAMYNLTGQEIKALPLLRTLAARLPANSIVLNNVGQCYMGLGLRDSALLYLKKCIAVEPHHPEANNTAAVIALARGNREAAGRYLENSLRGAFTYSAAAQYKDLYPDRPVGRFVRPRTHFPDYFNENKYHLPPQCESVDSVEIVKQLHKDFERRMEQLIEKYDALESMEEQIGEKELKDAVQVTMKTYKPIKTQPFTIGAGFMLMDYAIELGQGAESSNRYLMNREAEIDSLKEEFRRRTDHGISCEQLTYLDNLYMKKAAIIRRDIQEKQLRMEKEEFNETSYWGYLAGVTGHNANAAFYGAVVKYLSALKNMSETWYLSGCDETYSTPALNNFNDEARPLPDCPIDINIPFIIGNMELNCKNFSLKFGAGITTTGSSEKESGSGVEAGAFFTYEKDFESRESTMSVGISLGFEKGKGGIGGGAGAEEAIYIAFDENNHVMDAGLKFSANAQASVRFDTGQKYLSTGNEEVIRAKGEFGYKIGINSGWTFTEPDAGFEGLGKEYHYQQQNP
jgi:tetratricopeptide (TPR) repeat protein